MGRSSKVVREQGATESYQRAASNASILAVPRCHERQRETDRRVGPASRGGAPIQPRG
jgi:hypothetical protein